MFDVNEVCETFAKKMKWFNTTASVIGTNLKASIDKTGEISITAFASGAGLPVGISLSETNLCFPLTTTITKNYFLNIYYWARKT